MTTKGIRGAITVEANTREALEEATLELLSTMFEKITFQELLKFRI